MNSTEIGRRVSRGVAAGFLMASAVGLAACESPSAPVATPTRPAVLGPLRPPTIPSALEFSRTPTSESIKDPEKRKLFEVVEGLPSSPIKTVIRDRILPIYGNQPPQELDYHGVKVKLVASKVTTTTGQPGSLRANGHFYLIGEGLFKEEALYPVKDQQLFLPYVGPFLPSEKNQLDPRILLPNGTPLIEFDYRQNDVYYNGFAPLINFVVPNTTGGSPEVNKTAIAVGKGIRLKELCSHLAVDLWTEESVYQAQQFNLPISVAMRRPDGSVVNTEAISYMTNQFLVDGHRIVGVIDLGAYYLAFKAGEGTDFMNPLYMDVAMRAAYESSKRYPLGNTHAEMINSAIRWAITAPEAKGLLHDGDLKTFP